MNKQRNGCYCVETHSTPREIAKAFDRCKHPQSERVLLSADGTVVQSNGLEFCCHCGAHRQITGRSKEWVYSHLAAAIICYVSKLKSRKNIKVNA